MHPLLIQCLLISTWKIHNRQIRNGWAYWGRWKVHWWSFNVCTWEEALQSGYDEVSKTSGETPQKIKEQEHFQDGTTGDWLRKTLNPTLVRVGASSKYWTASVDWACKGLSGYTPDRTFHTQVSLNKYYTNRISVIPTIQGWRCLRLAEASC